MGAGELDELRRQDELKLPSVRLQSLGAFYSILRLSIRHLEVIIFLPLSWATCRGRFKVKGLANTALWVDGVM